MKDTKDTKTAKDTKSIKSTKAIIKDKDGADDSGSSDGDSDMKIIISLFLSHMVGVGIIVSQLMPLRKYTATLICTIGYDILLVSFFLCLDRKLELKQKQKQKMGTAGNEKNVENEKESESISECSALSRKKEFLSSRHGAGYGYKNTHRGFIDQWRHTEFPSLLAPLPLSQAAAAAAATATADNTNTNTSNQDKEVDVEEEMQDDEMEMEMEMEVYLDHAGSALPTQSLLTSILTQQTSHSKNSHSNSHSHQILANPHSNGPAAARTKLLMQQTKKRILDFFHADAGFLSMMDGNIDTDSTNASNDTSDGDGIGEGDDEKNDADYHPGYDVIFTSGATEALKIVAEHFHWTPPSPSPTDADADLTTDATASEGDTPSNHQGPDPNSNANMPIRSTLLYAHNSHTSVIGMREPAMAHGAQYKCRDLDEIIMAGSKEFEEWCQDQDQEKGQGQGQVQVQMQVQMLVQGKQAMEGKEEIVKEDVETEVEVDGYTLVQKVQREEREDEGEGEGEDALQTDEDAKTIKTTTTTTTTTANTTTATTHNHLLVIPLECNFGGDRVRNANQIFKTARAASATSSSSSTSQSQSQSQWYTMLDIAKAAATSPGSINLRALDPDFACVSFYKIFGAPTGIGALFVKRSSMHALDRDRYRHVNVNMNVKPGPGPGPGGSSTRRYQYFGGGGVDMVLSREDYMRPRSRSSTDASSGSSMSPLDGLVHGTTNFRSIIDLNCGLDELEHYKKVKGKDSDLYMDMVEDTCADMDTDTDTNMNMIGTHVESLAVEAFVRLDKLRHGNAKHVIELYGEWGSIKKKFTAEHEQVRNEEGKGKKKDGPHPKWKNLADMFYNSCDHDNEMPIPMSVPVPGPTIAFNVIRSDGSYVGYNEVAKLAALSHNPIQFRTGCFCNPGACATALKLSESKVKSHYEKSGHVCGDHIDVIDETPTGAVRMSFGKDSIWEDLDAACRFLENTFVNGNVSVNDGSTSSANSNEDEFRSTSSKVENETTEDISIGTKSTVQVRMTEIYVFPIKSCAAMEVSKWKIRQDTGALLFDREFALVDSSGSVLRLNQYPKMASIHPIIDISEDEDGCEVINMRVTAPGQPDLHINIGADVPPSPMIRQITVCGENCNGILWGSHATSKWFTNYLGVQCWFARSCEGRVDDSTPGHNHDNMSLEQKQGTQNISSALKPNEGKSGFANESPLLLLSQTSVDTLNGILQGKTSPLVQSKHFRPNLVVAVERNGADTHVTTPLNPEDQWKSLTMIKQNITLSANGLCARCSMVDIDPVSCMRGKTLKALSEYRKGKGLITFGIFLRMATTEHGRKKEEVLWIQKGDIMKVN